jgi:hypothetical protein
LALLALALFSRWDAGLEGVYAAWIGPGVNVLQTGFTRWVPVSFAEFVVLAGGFWLLVVPAAAWLRVPAGERRAAAEAEVWRGVAVASFVVLAFYALWGLNYARADLPTRLGWAESPDRGGSMANESAAQELTRLAEQLVRGANAEYLNATGSSDLGRPSGMSDARATDRALEDSLAELSGTLRWSGLNALGRGPVKPVMASGIMSRLGISGIYFPLTGEANVNRMTPASQLPLSMAHEKAHQRGITSEDEANFVGFLAAASSDDPYARYSALLFAQRQLLNELYVMEPEKTAELVAERLPGVQRDVDAAADYWRQFDGPPRRAQETINDTYLRINGVEGGIDSYQMSARLLVRWAREQGGQLVPRGLAFGG